MKISLPIIMRGVRRVFRIVGEKITELRCKYSLWLNQVEYSTIHSNGLPYICVAPSGKLKIGKGFSMNNGLRFNPIGFPQPCTLYVGENAQMTIGENCGISQASLICHYNIELQTNVKIGGVLEFMILISIRLTRMTGSITNLTWLIRRRLKSLCVLTVL